MSNRFKRKIKTVSLLLVLAFLCSCSLNNNAENKKADDNIEVPDLQNNTKTTSEWREDKGTGLSMEIVELDTSQYITWPDIYGDYVVFANYNIVTEERRQIHLFNTVTKKDQIIYSAKDVEYDSMIEDTRIGNGWVFWTEGHWTTEALPSDWTIKAYNIQNKQIKVIRSSSELPGKPTLAPRIDNEENTIVWLEGSMDTDSSLKHTVYSYNADSDTVTKIADVSRVENPYTITKLRNGTVCFADYINNNWVIRIIDLDTMTETSVPVDKYPQQPCSDGKIVAWGEGVKELWYMNLKNQERGMVAVVKNPALFDIHGGCIFTAVNTDDRHIYKCDVTNKAVTCVTKSAEQDYDKIDFRFFNFYGDKMVCVYDRTLYDEDHHPKGVKFDLVIVDDVI
jgi:hypothetical protein